VKYSLAFILTLLTLAVTPVYAQDVNSPVSSKTITQSYQGKGIVNSVDIDASKINMTHDAIKSLDWPGMTMDFEVQDKSMLTKLKPGQKVSFRLIEVSKSRFVINKIKLIK
jgi:Cu/Ag efflux protein CusF